jgi:hypothetical protein
MRMPGQGREAYPYWKRATTPFGPTAHPALEETKEIALNPRVSKVFQWAPSREMSDPEVPTEIQNLPSGTYATAER